MLEEVGQPYDIKLLRLSAGDNMKPDYLAINPMGKVPALKHRDTVITELAAICTYLADEFPEKKLNVPVGAPKRGVYLKWLFFRSGLPRICSDRSCGTAQGRSKARDARLWRFRHHDERAGERGREGALADGRSVHCGRCSDRRQHSLGHDFQDDSERKEFTDYVARIVARPAAQRSEAKDKELGAQAA